MAESIAKLAVIITGDASPLAAGLAQAGQAVKRFAGGVGSSATAASRSLGGVGQSSIGLSKALSALRGNWTAAFNVGGGGALAIAAMTLAVHKLASAGDALLQKIGADKLETWAGQWERVNEQLGITGMHFTTIAREASSDLADTLGSINAALLPDSVAYVESLKAREAAEKKYAEDKEKAAKAAEKQTKANKEAAEAQQKERDALLDIENRRRDRAADIKESVVSPAEEMQRTFHELRTMLGEGLIDEETALRAGRKAREAFDGGKPKPDDQGRAGIAAADKFTMAGFSAIQGGLREIERLERVQKDQLKEDKDQTALQKEIRDILHGQRPVILREGEP